MELNKLFPFNILRENRGGGGVPGTNILGQLQAAGAPGPVEGRDSLV
jgi:hypothetical protein